jgi:hypothetical protein
VRIYITSTHACKLQRIQRKFLSLCLRRFLNHLQYNHADVLDYLKFHTLIVRRRHPDALFLINVYNKSEFFPSLWKLPAFVYRHETSKILLYSVLSLNVAAVPLDAHRWLLPSAQIWYIREKACFAQRLNKLFTLITGAADAGGRAV